MVLVCFCDTDDIQLDCDAFAAQPDLGAVNTVLFYFFSSMLIECPIQLTKTKIMKLKQETKIMRNTMKC